jgi:prolyl oligopeptidase PreP (S9A serine peptidase family)
VLQVDFRGSTGYGKAHTQAAIGQFAGRMHDDLIDALDRAIDQGYTDPDRVAIYGSSYATSVTRTTLSRQRRCSPAHQSAAGRQPWWQHLGGRAFTTP